MHVQEEKGSLKDVEQVNDPKCEEEEHSVVQGTMPLAEDGREEKSHKQKEDLRSRVHVGEVLTVFECKARPNVKERNNAIAMSIASSAQEGSTITSQKSTSSRISNTSANRKRAASPTPVSGMSSNKKPRILVFGSGQSAGKKKVKKSQRNRNKKTDDAPAPPQGALQLARYATEMLSARGDRKFTVGVRLNARQMSFSFYNRRSIIETKAFDLCDPENQKYFAMFLLMFQRHPTTYGFNSITGYRDPFDLENTETQKMKIADLLDAKYSTFDQSVYSDLKLENALSSEFCLIGRGSSVFRVSAPMDSKAPTMAVKFSWQESTRRHEIENILDARRILKNKNVVEAYGYANLQDDSPGKALYDACTKKQRCFKERRFRILVMKYYHTLSEIEDYAKFRKLIIQLVECEYNLSPRFFQLSDFDFMSALHLLFKGRMLHRDISIGNLAYEEAEGELSIIILDFELAVRLDDVNNGRNSFRTGTAPFMAREVLDGFKTSYTHSLHHDLESVFYVIVWHAAGYRGSNLPKKGDPLRSWRKGGYENMRLAKDAFLENWSPLEPFISIPAYRIWIEELHSIYGEKTSHVHAHEGQKKKIFFRKKRLLQVALKARKRAENLSDEAYEELYKNELKALGESDNKLSNTASFRSWMNACMEPIRDDHSGCECCEDSEFDLFGLH